LGGGVSVVGQAVSKRLRQRSSRVVFISMDLTLMIGWDMQGVARKSQDKKNGFSLKASDSSGSRESWQALFLGNLGSRKKVRIWSQEARNDDGSPN
jgi:hypothetical protein